MLKCERRQKKEKRIFWPHFQLFKEEKNHYYHTLRSRAIKTTKQHLHPSKMANGHPQKLKRAKGYPEKKRKAKRENSRPYTTKKPNPSTS